MYNASWSNERAIEIPLAQERIRQAAGKRILEIGNVLAYYGQVPHEVVDKYERADGVRNIDVVDFHPAAPYDLIISISTLEHVGWDETPRDPAKLLRAVTHLTGLLAPGGELFRRWFREEV